MQNEFDCLVLENMVSITTKCDLVGNNSFIKTRTLKAMSIYSVIWLFFIAHFERASVSLFLFPLCTEIFLPCSKNSKFLKNWEKDVKFTKKCFDLNRIQTRNLSLARRECYLLRYWDVGIRVKYCCVWDPCSTGAQLPFNSVGTPDNV